MIINLKPNLVFLSKNFKITFHLNYFSIMYYLNKSIQLLLLVGFTLAQRNPSISFISKEKVVNIGDNVQLKCQAQDTDNYPVSWTKLGPEQIFISKGQSIIIPSDRHQIVYDQKDSTYTLIINKVQEIDVGIYRCEIKTAVNSEVHFKF